MKWASAINSSDDRPVRLYARPVNSKLCESRPIWHGCSMKLADQILSSQVDKVVLPFQLATMNVNILSRLSSGHLRRVAAIREQIEQKESELTALLGIPEALTVGAIVRRHRSLSAATRAKLSAAAKSRWAKIKAGKP